MRKKEGLSDYRYFPEPDLPGVILTKAYVDAIRDSLPEAPEMKRRRYEKMGLSMQDVLFLANDINVSPLFYFRTFLQAGYTFNWHLKLFALDIQEFFPTKRQKKSRKLNTKLVFCTSKELNMFYI